MDEVDPEAISDVRDHVATIAEMDYPKVWVGEVGLTADQLLALQEANDAGPDWLRVEPEELGGASCDWIEGDAALALIPDHFTEGELGNLQDEVMTVRAAKRGSVMVQRAYTIEYVVGAGVNALSEDDRLSLRAAWFEHDGEPAAMYYTGSTWRMIPVDELSAAEVDEHLLEHLEFYASGGTWPPYVVEDTPRARALVERRLGD